MTIKTTLKFFSLMLLSLSFVVLFSSFTFAAGNLCCETGNFYSSQSNECQAPAQGVKSKPPKACAQNEKCYGTNDNGPREGICSEKPPSQCCSGGFKFENGKCVGPKDQAGISWKSEDPKCSGGWCTKAGQCVVGTRNDLTPFQLCDAVGTESKSKCTDCLGGGGIWSAVGCIRFDPQGFITDFLKIALGVAGGIALLLMVYGSFQISTSAGDPKKAQEGREMITGTIAGLLFIIFSVVLLKVIGVDILKIPGLM